MAKAIVKSVEEVQGAKIFDTAPDYININGFVYEKQGKADEAVTLSLDLDDDSLRIVSDLRKRVPGYMNDQEVIREAIRNGMKSGALTSPTKRSRKNRK